MHVICIIV